MNGLTKFLASVALAALALGQVAGCAVGQAPGRGRVFHLQEPTTKGWYYLYLPEDYVNAEKQGLTAKHWPLVVTFHGMKPFDTASSQIREWQQEADRYGFVVAAPHCQSPDLLDEFPLRRVHPRVQRDETLTIHMLDDITRQVDIDPAHVLSTSWSSGGYLAHYMANRHSERFSCIAPRQSNFSAAVLDESRVPEYRDTKVGIFFTENDFAVCRRESQEAGVWYTRQGFDVTFAVFKDLGHERRPSVAAEFFAQTCGVAAKTPPTELAKMQVTRVPLPVVETELANGAREIPALPADDLQTDRPSASPHPASTSVAAHTRNANNPPRSPRRDKPAPAKRTKPTPARRAPQTTANSAATVRIRVSSTIGIAPLLVSFSALAPPELRRGSYFLWTLDGEPISNGINGQKYLTAAGKHELALLMTTSDGRELRSAKTVTVLERMTDEHAP